jgi:hypothetical protein
MLIFNHVDTKIFSLRTFFTVSTTASHLTVFSTTQLHCESLLRYICSVDPMQFDVILPPAPYVSQILQWSFSMPDTYRLHFLFFCCLTLIIQNSANYADTHSLRSFLLSFIKVSSYTKKIQLLPSFQTSSDFLESGDQISDLF